MLSTEAPAFRREALRRGEREADLAEAGLAQPLVAALVQRQARVDDAVTLEPSDHRLRAGHLRHAFGVDEARGLDSLQPCRGESADELSPRLRRDDLLLVLEPIPRAYFADQGSC